MRRLLLPVLCVAAAASAGTSAAAQGTPAATPAPAPGAVTVTAGVRARLEAWDWFDAAGALDAEDRYEFLGAQLRVGLQQQRPRLGWQVELAVPALVGLPGDAVAPPPQGQLGLGAAYAAANDGDDAAVGAFLKQAYLRLGAAPGQPGHQLRLGRFELVEGLEAVPANATLATLRRERVAHRLLGTFGWSHVGRSVDGAHWSVTRPAFHGTVAVARPTQGVFDVDGWPELDVGVAYGAVTLRDRPGAARDARLFALHYHDYRDDAGVVKVDNRPLAARQADRDDVRVTTLGGHWLQAWSGGGATTDLMLWGAWQLGGWGTLDHQAWAAAAEVGVQPGGLPRLSPWLRAGIWRGSGDDDPTDDEHGTFFQVLPTPRLHARFPFHNLMNVQDVWGSVQLRPAARVSLRTELHALRLAARRDLWYAGGGAFEQESFGYAGRPSSGAASLATLWDLSADVRLTRQLTSTLYLGLARGGDVVERIYPAGSAGRLAYLELEWRY